MASEKAIGIVRKIRAASSSDATGRMSFDYDSDRAAALIEEYVAAETAALRAENEQLHIASDARWLNGLADMLSQVTSGNVGHRLPGIIANIRSAAEFAARKEEANA